MCQPGNLAVKEADVSLPSSGLIAERMANIENINMITVTPLTTE